MQNDWRKLRDKFELIDMNLFPDSCGYNVAAAWCPITDTQTILVILIIAIGLGTLWSYIEFRKEENEHRKKN